MSVRIESANAEGLYRTTAPVIPFTLMAWVKIWSAPAGAAVGALLQAWDNGWSGGAVAKINSSRALIINTFQDDESHTGSTLALDTWYHVAWVKDANDPGETQMYLGAVADGLPCASPWAQCDELSLGYGRFGGNNDNADISIAYARVFGAALNATQIAAERDSATPVLTGSLWADWPLTVHTDVTDHSGNGRELTAQGTLSTDADFGGGGPTPAFQEEWFLPFPAR